MKHLLDFDKGSMRLVKQVLGASLLVMAAGFIFDIETIKDVVMNYWFISIGSMLLSSFFLLKEGYYD